MLTINTITRYGRPSLNAYFQPFSQWKLFSVPNERHRFSKSRDITLHTSFHWHDKYHNQKLEHVVVMIAWNGNATIDRKTISGLNHIT